MDKMGLPGEVSAMVSVAVPVPLAVGVNVTLTEQLLPTAKAGTIILEQKLQTTPKAMARGAARLNGKTHRKKKANVCLDTLTSTGLPALAHHLLGCRISKVSSASGRKSTRVST
jgi:hypothetical protein